MTDETDNQYKCKNCRKLVEGDYDPEYDVCPACEMPHLGQMQRVECHDCGSVDIEFFQQSFPFRINGPQPIVVCSECGRDGEVDQEGVWW